MVTSTISVGEVLPFNILRLITVVGIIVTDAVFNTKNVIKPYELDIYILGVSHWGTGWDYVPTEIKIKKAIDL